MSLTPRHSSGFTLHASFIMAARGEHSLNVISAPMDAQQIENLLRFINLSAYETPCSIISSRSRVTLIVCLFSAIGESALLLISSCVDSRKFNKIVYTYMHVCTI